MRRVTFLVTADLDADRWRGVGPTSELLITQHTAFEIISNLNSVGVHRVTVRAILEIDDAIPTEEIA